MPLAAVAQHGHRCACESWPRSIHRPAYVGQPEAESGSPHRPQAAGHWPGSSWSCIHQPSRSNSIFILQQISRNQLAQKPSEQADVEPVAWQQRGGTRSSPIRPAACS